MELEELIQEFSSSNFLELELRSGKQSVRLSRRSPESEEEEAEVQDAEENAAAEELPSSPAEDPSQSSQSICAQRVGFFFPAVKKGDQILPGDLIGQLKAMNINHEVRSELSGVVESVCIEVGKGAAYGDPLVKLVNS